MSLERRNGPDARKHRPASDDCGHHATTTTNHFIDTYVEIGPDTSNCSACQPGRYATRPQAWHCDLGLPEADSAGGDR